MRPAFGLLFGVLSRTQTTIRVRPRCAVRKGSNFARMQMPGIMKIMRLGIRKGFLRGAFAPRACETALVLSCTKFGERDFSPQRHGWQRRSSSRAMVEHRRPRSPRRRDVPCWQLEGVRPLRESGGVRSTCALFFFCVIYHAATSRFPLARATASGLWMTCGRSSRTSLLGDPAQVSGVPRASDKQFACRLSLYSPHASIGKVASAM